ncbi:MAG: DUF362 domain-containing protein [Nanoarchaeota archaeon]|nr:DUF362 domain-containing protein [Nanoarchaeota archaeon]MCG2717899.1 DUF362 domain-containing protein [Nanoarchaeota archaeon]
MVSEYIHRAKKYFRLYKAFDPRHTVDIRNPMKKKKNVFVKGDNVLVSKVKANKNLKQSVKKSIDLIGGLKKSFRKSDSVLIVPNYNSDDNYPASTDIKFLEAVIKVLQEFGIRNITIGNASGVHWLPTRSVFDSMGVTALAKKMKVNFSCFEEKDWIMVKLDSDVLRDVSIAKEVFSYDKLIYLPCMKTHRRARFTMSLKLTMGLQCLKHRVLAMHTGDLENKIADLNKAVSPDLIIMDARKIFVTGGPDSGKVKNHDTIYASGDRVAIDFVGLKDLLKYRNEDNLLDKPNPEDYDQIKRAFKIKLGVKKKELIKIIKG